MSASGPCVKCGGNEWWVQKKTGTRVCQPCRRRRVKLFELRNPEYRMWCQARYRAKRDGVEFSVTREDVRVPDLCPVFGTPLAPAKGSVAGGPNSPSIDRLDPSKGYTPDNTRVISWRANDLKRDASAHELRRIADWMDEQLHTAGRL